MDLCTECGARLMEETDRCDLCGWPVEGHANPSRDDPAGVIFCNRCGWKPSSDANFCSQCGAKFHKFIKKPPLRQKPSVIRKRPTNIESGVSLQVFAIVGLGVFLVVALFLVTVVSKRVVPPTAPTLSAAPAVEDLSSRDPLSEELANRINELDRTIESDTSAFSVALKREKIYVLSEGGRTDVAAEVQLQIAEETGLEEDWKTAGDLYYELMTEESQPQVRSRMADQAVSAYQKVLGLNPDHLDARTDMATAYLNTGSPMLGVTEIKKVLEVDPNHLNANFNYGLMLARINRSEEAIAQLELVLTLAPDPVSMHHQRAAILISTIREQSNL